VLDQALLRGLDVVGGHHQAVCLCVRGRVMGRLGWIDSCVARERLLARRPAGCLPGVRPVVHGLLRQLHHRLGVNRPGAHHDGDLSLDLQIYTWWLLGSN
jgi:hypothetical protein